MAAVAIPRAIAPPPITLHSNERSHLYASRTTLHHPASRPGLPSRLEPLLSLSPTSSDYASALESCTSFNLGKQIHTHAIKNDFAGHHEFLGTKLLIVYGKRGTFVDACKLFDEIPLRSIYTWTSMLTVCVNHGFCRKALCLFGQLMVEGVGLEFFVIPVVLKACSGVGALELGRELHGFVVKCGFVLNLYVANALVDMYGKCRVPDEAMKVFNQMPERDCVSWNSVIGVCAANGMVSDALEFLKNMQLADELKPNLVSYSAAIRGFAHNGFDEEALELLYQMVENGVKPNAQTLASVLPTCARLEALGVGKEIHGYVFRHGLMANSFAVNGLIDVYRRCNDMRSAMELFLRFSARNLVSYNTMIVGYCENNELCKAKELFERMELDGIKRDTVIWNSIISGCCDNEKYEEALEMFRVMQVDEGIEADSFTIGSNLSGCAALAALRQGKELHSYAIRRGLDSNNFVGGTLMQMYFRCQELDAAKLVFSRIVERNNATWNILISGYACANHVDHIKELLSLMGKEGLDPNIYTWNGILAGLMENGQNEQALEMLCEMINTKIRPDIFTIGMILTICSRLISIERGKQAHAYSIRCGYDECVHIGSALVDMYAKWGNVRLANLAFNRISQHNLICYNTMLGAYAMHGLGNKALGLFDQMMADGFRPDAITFISVLSSCVHNGLIEEGYQYFNMMKSYDIEPELQHYTCLIDLLGRSGQLHEAYELIQIMPMEPNVVVWSAFLSGCVIHGNVTLGEIAASKLIELDQNSTANYVLLSNLYARALKGGDLARIREVIKARRMSKTPGCSWMEHKGNMVGFLANDASHEQANDIYSTLEKLNSHMRAQGDLIDIAEYLPNLRTALVL